MRNIILFLTFSFLFPSHPILIDGSFDDWDEVSFLYNDDVNDDATSLIDIKSIKVTNDQDYLFIYLELNDDILIQQNNTLTLYLDTDNNSSTGYLINSIGADLLWNFGLREGIFYNNNIQFDIKYYDINIVTAPSFSSKVFEIVLNRNIFLIEGYPLFTSNKINILFADENSDMAPNIGEIINYEFDSLHIETDAIDFSKNNSNIIRVMTYNIETDFVNGVDAIFDLNKQNKIMRIIQAINPDIINLQEIFFSTNEQILELINVWLPLNENGWYAQNHGDRMSISKFPIIQNWPAYYPLDDKITLIPIQVNENHKLIIFNAHFTWGTADEERQNQADSFIAYLRDMMTEGDYIDVEFGTPFILLGDLNLYGDSQQLTTLLEGEIINNDYFGDSHIPDWDETPLKALFPRHTEKRMTYTWRKDYNVSGFSPGKLDYIIYSNSVISVNKSFTVYTPEMSDYNLSSLNLQNDDTIISSDHLPLVADFIIHYCNYSFDVNFDGFINILDIIQAVNYILDEISLNEIQICNADINQDGEINILDITNILNIILDN